MILQIALCDNEAPTRNDVIQKLQNIDVIFETTEFSNSFELINSTKKFDLIFIDLQMEGLNGMEVASILRENGCLSNIVFISNDTEFMRDAFKVKAFRFLEKPASTEQLEEAITGTCLELLKQKNILIKCDGQIVRVNCDDIICLEAFGDGIYIYTKNNILCTYTQLKKILEELDENTFMQVHKSFVVALKYINSLNNNSITMDFMKNEIPVSRRKSPKLKRRYSQYIHNNTNYVRN